MSLVLLLLGAWGGQSVSSCGPECDIYPQIRSAVRNCELGQADCRILLDPGQYRLSRTVELCPGVEIYGASEQMTLITVDSQKSAFHVLPFGECQQRELPYQGNVRIEGMKLIGETSSYVTYGVWAENRVHISRLEIGYFTQGIRISAGVGRTVPGNANMFSVKDVWIYWTDHSGFSVDGSDVNSGIIDLLHVGGPACVNPSPFTEELGECAGIYDDGFLGRAYSASVVGLTWNGARPYVMKNRNAKSTMIIPYSENFLGNSYSAPGHLLLGGHSSWDGNPGRIWGYWSTGFRFINNLDPEQELYFDVGRMTGSPGVFTSTVVGP